LSKYFHAVKETTHDDVNLITPEARAPPRGRSSAPYALAWPVAAALSAWEDRQTVRISLLENHARVQEETNEEEKNRKDMHSVF
jgi:hypothetical protein